MEIEKLEEKLMELSVELTALKHITDGLDKKLDQQIHHWLQDVERIEVDNDEMQAQLCKLGHPYASDNQHERIEHDKILLEDYNMKITKNLDVVQALKQAAFEKLLLQITEDKLKRYSHDDLSLFTSKFSTKIGVGGFSKVYLGQLSDGAQVAVKVLTQNHHVPKDILQDIFVIEVGTTIKASHPNLIKLYGFCFDENTIALVYEYMENGSLDKVLFKKHIVVDWQRLYRIAIGTAKVLAFLHHDCDDQIIHHDIKPANILLDSNLSPKVTDFGVAKIMKKDATHFTMTRTRGTSCYIAPEMTMQASRVTYTCDIYSFGMTLFDILGMRIHSQSQPSFPKLVWREFDKGRLDDIIKECEIGEENAESARILSMVALWCIQFTPEIRPSMKMVVNVLQKNLQVASPPNPFLASDKPFSIKLSQDMTDSTASPSTHQSLSQGNSFMDYFHYYWDTESEKESSDGSRETSPSAKNVVNLGKKIFQRFSLPPENRTVNTLKELGKNFFKRNRLETAKTTLTQFSREDLKSFTKGFSTKVCYDGYSNIYKGEFPNGEQILVKVLTHDHGDKERLEAEIKAISITSHRNIIKLYGFCFSRTMKALVLEFMENGSLAEILFKYHPRSIEWEHLYRIATETAKGISYLHDGCDELIIHMDIKPSNILLDSSLSPKVANFFPTRLADMNLTHLATIRKDTLYYLSPEALKTQRVTYKCDVYSFGVTLFEIFGRQKCVSGSVNFIRTCWMKFESGEMEEFLTERGFVEKNREDATILLMVAFWCVQFSPEARPPMRTVVMMLEKEREVTVPPNPFKPNYFH